MFIQPFSFVSYYVLELNLMMTFLIFRRHNSWLRERYGDDLSTHLDFDPDLWMEAASSGGPDRNQVYSLSNITIENLWATCSISTVGSSQSVSSVAHEKIHAALAGNFFRCVVALIGLLESPPSNLLKATRKPDVLVLPEIRG
jgi:hypothetical protein